MSQPEKFSLRWNEFEETVSQGLRDLHSAGQLHDITLGEVSIGQDRLTTFLGVADDLQVKGLTHPDPGDSQDKQPPRQNRRKMYSSTSQLVGKKARIQSPSSGSKPSDDASNTSDDPIAAVQVKAEPSSLAADPKPAAETSTSKLALDAALRRQEETSREIAVEETDYAAGFGSVSYNDYQDDAIYDHDDDISMLPGHFSGGGASLNSFPFVASDQEQIRNRRQLILQFITANKGRLSDTYVCLICNKQVTDNSNMNKHLEFKHGTELKMFLQSLAL